MSCSEENKTTLGTYALREEAIVWWRNVRLRIGVDGVAIVWETFKREFLRKYFPADVKNKKVIEFMELKQGNLSVAEYTAKFEALCVFSPHYNTVEAEEDKCVKFESGLRPDIKLLIGFSEIRDFPTLMTKARICDEDRYIASTLRTTSNRARRLAEEGDDRKPAIQGCWIWWFSNLGCDEEITQQDLNEAIQGLGGPMTRERAKKAKEGLTNLITNLMGAEEQKDEIEPRIINLITSSEDGIGTGHAAQI
ncbi:unnamed protein product [Trifolium pratense]|uniref:Uncharacterized protein n=1 Tax=Trifolium pratense TaxID=57577 RepID=A0ACB0IV95_TRIPR|nr:unnamed protein product [Trifolium pratense]